MSLHDLKQNYLSRSRQDEQTVSDILGQYGCTTRSATLAQDTQHHIDLWFTTPKGQTRSADVKGYYKLYVDGQMTDRYVWIEIQNVQGKRGWVYGDQDYVVWIRAQGQRLLFVDRAQLADYITKKLQGVSPVTTKPDRPYIPYQRQGRQDIIVIVPISDIQDNCWYFGINDRKDGE